LRPTGRSSGSQQHGGGRSDDQQLLADREAELLAIRSTMEKNESAILRAMEDQRRAWESEVAAERESWERRVRDAERQTDNVRDTLTDRIRNLERENAALQSANVELCHGYSSSHPHRPADNDQQPSQRSVDELPVHRGSFKQLTANGVDDRPYTARNFTPGSVTSSGKTASVLSSVEQRPTPPTALNGESTGTDAAVLRLPAITERPATRCQHCKATITELERVKQEFAAERQQWLAEKRRVITYQKLLQNKYVQLEQRCAELEGSAYTDNLIHTESVDGIMSPSLANGHAPRGGWHSGHTQSSPPLLLPKLTPFGQSIHT